MQKKTKRRFVFQCFYTDKVAKPKIFTLANDFLQINHSDQLTSYTDEGQLIM